MLKLSFSLYSSCKNVKYLRSPNKTQNCSRSSSSFAHHDHAGAGTARAAAAKWKHLVRVVADGRDGAVASPVHTAVAGAAALAAVTVAVGSGYQDPPASWEENLVVHPKMESRSTSQCAVKMHPDYGSVGQNFPIKVGYTIHCSWPLEVVPE